MHHASFWEEQARPSGRQGMSGLHVGKVLQACFWTEHNRPSGRQIMPGFAQNSWFSRPTPSNGPRSGCCPDPPTYSPGNVPAPLPPFYLRSWQCTRTCTPSILLLTLPAMCLDPFHPSTYSPGNVPAPLPFFYLFSWQCTCTPSSLLLTLLAMYLHPVHSSTYSPGNVPRPLPSFHLLSRQCA